MTDIVASYSCIYLYYDSKMIDTKCYVLFFFQTDCEKDQREHHVSPMCWLTETVQAFIFYNNTISDRTRLVVVDHVTVYGAHLPVAVSRN